jgi:signal transduction histidine kinase
VPRVWLLIAAASIVPAILDGGQIYMQGWLMGEPVRWEDVVFQGSEWLFLGALTPITYYLGQRFPLRRRVWPRALGVHVAGALLLCVGWAALGILLGAVLQRFPATGDLPRDFVSWVLRSLPWSVFMYFTVLGCVYAFTYFIEAREREMQASRLAAQLAEARLGALRMQLHPHFLFNSLNAVTVLVREQHNVAAARMLELLSDLLRQALRSDQPQEVPLGDELEFIERYLAIEQVRFSDRLHVEWAIDDRAAGRLEIAARVVALRLADARSGRGAQLELAVRDDGVGMPGAQAEGVGLANTRERLRTMYGGDASLTIESRAGGGTEVVIILPFRQVER